jgi:hypothetical protein
MPTALEIAVSDSCCRLFLAFAGDQECLVGQENRNGTRMRPAAVEKNEEQISRPAAAKKTEEQISTTYPFRAPFCVSGPIQHA